MAFINVPSSIDKKTFRKCILLFAVLSFVIYGKSIMNGFAMDDEYVMLNNKQVHGGIKKIPEIFRSTYSTDEKSSYEYRPIVKATYAIEYQFFGENPHVSHFINILLYILLMILLFYILLRLLPSYTYLFSLTVVLLFLVHPLHSEVVMSIKNRDVLLCSLACFSALLFYLRYAEGKSMINLLWGFLCLIFSLLSKRDSMTFFALIPFTIWFFRNISWQKVGVMLLTYLPIIFLVRAAARFVIKHAVSSRIMLPWENPLFYHSSFFKRMPEGFYCIYFYLKMFILPYPLISYYGYDQAPIIGWGSAYVFMILAVFVVTGYLIVKHFAARPLWVYGALYFIITISMFGNVVVPVVGIVGERFAFIPSLGLCIVAVDLLFTYFKVPLTNLLFRFKSLNTNLLVVFAIVLLLFSGKTFSRNAAWKDAFTLYKTDAETATESAHEHSLLGAAAIARVMKEPKLSVQEKRELVLLAEKHYNESLRIIPDYTSVHNNLGMVYYTYMGMPDKAIPHLQRAVELDTTYVEAYYNLASCYAAVKQFDSAEKYYLKAISINPKFSSAYVALSNMYAMSKQYEKIIRVNQAAIDKGIESDAMYVNIGNVYFMNGDTLKALPYLEAAIQHNGNNRRLNGFLAGYYREKGNAQKAAYYSDLMSRSSPQ